MSKFKSKAARLALATIVTTTAAALSSVLPASAHASLQLYGSTPVAGGYGHMFVRVPHGCDGAATDTVKVQIPAGFTSVKAQAKAGWQVATVKADGTNVSEVIWSGGSLPDSQFDDFGISVKFPTAPGVYYAPVVQMCGSASAAWVQIPAAGENSHSLKSPAPSVKVLDKAPVIPARWTGDVTVKQTTKMFHVSGDMSSIHRGKTAALRVTQNGRKKVAARVKLDKAGDFDRTFVANKTNKARFAPGAVVEVVVRGKVLATFTVPGHSSTTSGHSSTTSGH
jgi:uncharacterized protein YcnI